MNKNQSTLNQKTFLCKELRFGKAFFQCLKDNDIKKCMRELDIYFEDKKSNKDLKMKGFMINFVNKLMRMRNNLI